jgi:hypothetical protein
VEDRALLGSNLSADSGAKNQTRGGFPRPAFRTQTTGIGSKALNPRGLGTESPGSVPFFLLGPLSVPLIQRCRSFVGTHISALNFRMSLFR